MLLLDTNNEPTNTVYYLSAVIYGTLRLNFDVDCASLYDKIVKEVVGNRINFDFYMMALDFLFLLDKITVDSKGELHVH